MNNLDQTRIAAAQAILTLIDPRPDPPALTIDTPGAFTIIDAITDHIIETLKSRFLMYVEPRQTPPG